MNIKILKEKKNGIYDFLSGVSVDESTKFFNLKIKENLEFYKDLIYFFEYAAASYGWPLYVYRSPFGCLNLLPNIKLVFYFLI